MDSENQKTIKFAAAIAQNEKPARAADNLPPPAEQGGKEGPEPTRYGDWEIGGKCVDF